MKGINLKSVSCLFLLMVLSGTSCKKEDPGVLVEKQILKFTDFGCSNVSWQFKPGFYFVAPSYSIASSQQELEKCITINCIPQIAATSTGSVSWFKQYIGTPPKDHFS